jgi:hypothetical protein
MNHAEVACTKPEQAVSQTVAVACISDVDTAL